MENFSSKDLALQAQKKILSRMATKSMVNMFIDETSSEVLDELYRVSKEYTKNKTESQKVIKNLIKIAVKIGVLYRHNRFSSEELVLAEDFKEKLHNGAMTAISFYEVEFTYEKEVLPQILTESKNLLLRLVENHLTSKSLGRIQHVFNHFANQELLSQLYNPEGELRPHLQKICMGLNKLIDEGKL
ncbi:tumor necrosis factor alpha-induced protein 8-like protein 2 [Spea bombifrons]|uniref:tumor necrosis factor alpha-induced protein 8-like protein 2 n=1 Tax=Spea bombifrons TaxID=233779 RepID=UPI002349B600|nr:tumor necrosis factor alpha-induced protein 8-like protein 2 [Spea bombifrons]XP_053331259.1 tumor necrosis factor alpha-induced protein 8-like protein 2 [Spea bombifrons]XP_053331260.1 tumor necrosis factor alpha-induced protein 8-like protein 2 [Spea bombifrons]XP_053331261.1 tumor necrosis factor alpha-induced protein 8-like protein 2 [Spea bombifrons]XP_053331262.1 tumor necrosis factor alpha-induced protein 8-like protein 2 [Spea bombifrons]